MPSGSKARTVAPSAWSAGTITRLGLSRMSSVFGLKVTPRTAMVLPRTEPPQASTIRRTIRCACALVDRDHALDDAQGHVGFLGDAQQRQRVLGEARAAEARPGMQELAADPAVEADALGHVWTSAPTRSHRSAISLMKVILVARKALVAYLISSAVSSEVNRIGVWIRLSGR